MKCVSCGTDNEVGARFCGVCGATLQAPSVPPAGSSSVTCPSCNSVNLAGSVFCENCGARIGSAPAPAPVPTTGTAPRQTSAAWWLLPIFMAWVGGLIGWLVIKQDDEAKARGLLILGIVMTFVWVAAGIVASLFGALTVY